MLSEPSPIEPDDVVVYRGHHDGHTVTVEIPGVSTGPLPHIARHSSEFSWGYGGSGPADLALSLLVHALGDDVRCTYCGGRGYHRAIVEPVDGYEDPLPIAPCAECERGVIRGMPYQQFKWDVVSELDYTWTLTRAEIHAWAVLHPIVAAHV